MAKTFDEQIDDYKDSIFAIVGFINLFRYDDAKKSFKRDVKVFQGRRMKTSQKNRVSPNNEVTPDFCIQSNAGKGVVGEVKKSFPDNQDYWMDDFKQLMSYDDDLDQWVGKVDDHEIVLLPEQTRTRTVKKFFEDRNGKDILFQKNFVIVEFNRNDQKNPFFFFRKDYGNFKYFDDINKRLEAGVAVPMLALMPHYEKIKLYDSKPPLPYLLHLIWESVVMFKASNNERFGSMRANGKMPVDVTVDEIVNILHEDYSFKTINSDNGDHQPQIPLKSWVVEAVNALVDFKLAKNTNPKDGEYTIYFKKFKETKEEFIRLCLEHKIGGNSEEKQMAFFDNA